MTTETYEHIDYEPLPEQFRGGLRRYIEDGLPPGDFLMGLLKNDLMQAVAHADDNAAAHLVEMVRWMYNQMPVAAWGSSERMHAWMIWRQEERR